MYTYWFIYVAIVVANQRFRSVPALPMRPQVEVCAQRLGGIRLRLPLRHKRWLHPLAGRQKIRSQLSRVRQQ